MGLEKAIRFVIRDGAGRYTDHGTGFSTSDSPLIIADKDTDRVGLGEGLALGDSSLILMPVSRRLACAFTTSDNKPLRLTNRSVEMINKQFTWRNAVNSVVAHPNEHPSGVVPDFAEWAENIDD